MNNLRLSDARVRITAAKVEMIAIEIASLYPDSDEHGKYISGLAIDLLYERTRALRQREGVDREVYAHLKNVVDNFNITKFMTENGFEYF